VFFRTFRKKCKILGFFYVAQEKLLVILLTVRIMPKLSVIRIKLFLNQTTTSAIYIYVSLFGGADYAITENDIKR
jgi:hypothetical protein